MKSTTFTSSLPEELLDLLESYAGKFNVPKNRILEKALRAYFERMKKAEYIHSFRRAAGDENMLSMAEEGLEDYLKILDRK
jgi:predicted transcriptional regulator